MSYGGTDLRTGRRLPRTVDPREALRRKIKARHRRQGIACDCAYPYPTVTHGVELHEMGCPVTEED